MAEALAIRRATREDEPAILALSHELVTDGTVYPFRADMDDATLLAYWYSPGGHLHVATSGGERLGVYVLKPNQPGRGSHVANASYAESERCRGRGVGEALGRHSLEEARRLGFRAMQFNLVVATNLPAVKLWQKLGFAVSTGSCDLTSTTAGAKTLTATYEGDDNFSGSTSVGVAHYVRDRYTVTATAGTGGSLDGSTPSPQTVNEGAATSFTFNADAGYHVSSVSGCGGTAYNNSSNTVTTYTYTTGAITGACTVTATFKDTTPPDAPTVSGISPTTNPRPTWQWTSGGGGMGKFRRMLDSSGTWAYSGYATSYRPAGDLADGSYTLEVQERDGRRRPIQHALQPIPRAQTRVMRYWDA